MAKDPVCGMVVDPAKTVAITVYKEKTYYFCSSGCQAAFDRKPEKFLGKTETDQEQGKTSGGV